VRVCVRVCVCVCSVDRRNASQYFNARVNYLVGQKQLQLCVCVCVCGCIVM